VKKGKKKGENNHKQDENLSYHCGGKDH